MKQLLLLAALLWIGAAGAWAQMPHDAIYMSKKSICTAAMYGQSSWNHYWENTLKRENFNIGTHTTQSATLMVAGGLSNRVNLIVNVPYMWTSASAGNLMEQRGFQDLSGWVKVNAFRYKGFSLHGIAGGSLPLTSYVPSFLPMSIGMGARTASGRVLVNYRHAKTGLYTTAHGTYTWRGKIRLDHDAYLYNDRLYNAQEVAAPNAVDGALRLGYLRNGFQTEVFVERFTCLSGDHIRRNDMPFLTNNMQATTIGWYGKYEPKSVGVNARVGYVTQGLNVGQSVSFMLGLLYQFHLN